MLWCYCIIALLALNFPIPITSVFNVIPHKTESTTAATAKKKLFTEKTVFANLTSSSRFVFVAGLEGTGHHSMQTLFKDCKEKGVCQGAGELTRYIWSECSQPRNVIQTLGYAIGDPKEAQRKFLKAALEMKESEGFEGHLYFLNTLVPRAHGKITGMISFPNCDPYIMFPDISMMAELLEEAGIDFRVLVLHRPSHSILRSTLTHRHFRSPDVEERNLELGAAMMYAMLSKMDHRFFRVMEFHELNDRQAWEGGGAGMTDFLFGEKNTFRDFDLILDEARVGLTLWEKQTPPLSPGFFPAAVQEDLWARSGRLARYNDMILTLKE